MASVKTIETALTPEGQTDPAQTLEWDTYDPSRLQQRRANLMGLGAHEVASKFNPREITLWRLIGNDGHD